MMTLHLGKADAKGFELDYRLYWDIELQASLNLGTRLQRG